MEHDEDELVPRGYTVRKGSWKDIAKELADIVFLAGMMLVGLSAIWLFIWGKI